MQMNHTLLGQLGSLWSASTLVSQTNLSSYSGDNCHS